MPPPHAHDPPDMHTSLLLSRPVVGQKQQELTQMNNMHQYQTVAHCFTEMCTTEYCYSHSQLRVPKDGKFSLYDIFVGNVFVLKNFRRVDVLQKYFNTKILQDNVCNGFCAAHALKNSEAS